MDTSRNGRLAKPQPYARRIEPCLAEAKAIAKHLRQTDCQPTHQRFCNAFTALADGDTAVGLLAYYLWRRRVARPRAPQRPARLRRRR